jgi:glyoxylase-like metal-dependent hydrolase (beta-lactamase superfamily II)
MPCTSSLCRVLLSLLAVVVATPAFAADPVSEVRLYALDCGRVEFKDMGFFSDTGEYDGKPGNLAVPCFLIRHAKGALLWDTGLGDKLAESKDGVELAGGIRLRVPVTLAEQLKALSLTTADLTYVAFSHFHFDHTGNANLLGTSIWIINTAELNWALSTPQPFGVDPSTFSAYKASKTQMINGDHDVFGDGSVRILKAPGHTPGHQVLEIKLRKSGTVILSGDLYHTRDNRKYRRIPAINFERADTLASIDRIEKIVTNTKARLVVQHDMSDFAALPKFPAYLN